MSGGDHGGPLHVTSRDNPLLVRLRKLAQDPGAYRKLGEAWLEGDHLCSAFLARGGRPTQALVTESAWRDVPFLRGLAAQAPRVVMVPDALFKTVSGLESPARIGFVVAHQDAGSIEPGVASVVLDRLQDAGNVGSILRSAAAFGFRQVVALKGTAALWSPKVLRAGMGAHFALRLVELASADDLATLGVPLVATSSHADKALGGVAVPRPCAWLLGNEGQGVAPELLARCAMTLRIPQPGGEESLNVAAAAAICLFEAARANA